ncbi:benzoate/H(+) symporter BenE family transporter [Tsukamurella sp. 8F]|uniref:benzoate/H(+) symporter BenE family transporter n=1 Tax=unclassified Tsukamurella TaxID=2633480 RepID=UPI0023B8AC24|nr:MULTISPECIES: benzoate/H(+) symporter BenE family transporter [unclassified Tsukamurella]MDF0528767.1 benzoate/H(+) symporter BenE family transporter [Tsukamurella sp. 8J]MDF0586602.1 benzoate/H(+) symporter BenE family transporter [Tsukamurella sp. 8F]
MAERVSIAVPIGAGVVCALVGFTSSFAVVLAGLRAVGADAGQAASGLAAVSLAMGAATVLLSWRFRMPITSAWSTPGAALLVSTGAVAGGWAAAVGAFAVTGVLFVLTGLWPRLSALVARIPTPIAQAMLAGVLLPLCLEPVTGLAHDPAAIAPVLVVWLLLLEFAPKVAVPGAFVAALAVIAVSLACGGHAPAASAYIPHLSATAPTFTLQAMTGIVIPLYIVTMASQNIPGVAVMGTFGYRVPWRAALSVTGILTAAGAFLGAHAINLAAISAALAAEPAADPDPERRWVAAFTAGCSHLVLGVMSTGLTAVVLVAPDGVVQAVAGVALLGAFASSAAGAMADESARVPAAVTFVIAASGTAIAGIGSAFWALLVGIAVYLMFRAGRRRGLSGSAAEPSGARSRP